MATTSIWRVNGWLGKVLIYIENPDKTENPAAYEKQGMDGKEMLELLEKRGIDKQHIDIVRHSGIDLEKWLGGFETVESSVHETVKGLKEHPLMPKDVKISGFIMNSETGLLTKVEE